MAQMEHIAQVEHTWRRWNTLHRWNTHGKGGTHSTGTHGVKEHTHCTGGSRGTGETHMAQVEHTVGKQCTGGINLTGDNKTNPPCGFVGYNSSACISSEFASMYIYEVPVIAT